MLVFDIESDGLIGEKLSKIHCINAIDRRDGREYRYTDHEFYQDIEGITTKVKCPRDGNILDGLHALHCADVIAGHNIIGYDLPALGVVYPSVDTIIQLHATAYDSFVAAKLMYPDLKDTDWTRIRKGKLPESFARYAGRNSLRAWGIRIGEQLKAEFKPEDYGHTWETIPFIEEMDEYCMQDVRTNVSVIETFEKLNYSEDALQLEFDVQHIISQQERHGIRFDVKAAEKLAAKLYIELHELELEAREAFPPFYMKGKEFTPKADNKRYGYVAGAKVTKVELIEFNPGSRKQIENRLRYVYGWEPSELTKTGLAKIDDDILNSLPFKEARKIGRYMMVQKRLSALAEGKQAWLKKVKSDGRIYGRVDTLGTGTGRMSHFGPNLAQVPKNDPATPYGKECRELFLADEGRVLLGMDADALELRILAHFLARFDNGDYTKTVLSGSKAKGTDMHTRNQKAIKLTERETAKTWFYAFIYGAANFKLGTIVMSEWGTEKLLKFYKAFAPGQKRRSKIAFLGKRSRQRLLHTLPAFGKLVEKVQANAKRGYLFGLDRRKMKVRALHSALNFLCQGAGAIAMKRALVIMFGHFREEQLDVIPVLNVHDEVQLSVFERDIKNVGRIASQAVAEAGEYYNLRCPLAGDYSFGGNWAETH